MTDPAPGTGRPRRRAASFRARFLILSASTLFCSTSAALADPPDTARRPEAAHPPAAARPSPAVSHAAAGARSPSGQGAAGTARRSVTAPQTAARGAGGSIRRSVAPGRPAPTQFRAAQTARTAPAQPSVPVEAARIQGPLAAPAALRITPREDAGAPVAFGSAGSLPRRDFQAARPFRAPAYAPPAGYQARRWGHGDRLPRFYFIRNYWIGDYSEYDLLAPPPGLEWIRVGDDALLIDLETGEVIQAEYGVFD